MNGAFCAAATRPSGRSAWSIIPPPLTPARTRAPSGRPHAIRRHRDVSPRRYTDQGGPRVDGRLARGARADAGPQGGRTGLVVAAHDEDASRRRQMAAAPTPGPPCSARAGRPAEEGFRRSDRGVASGLVARLGRGSALARQAGSRRPRPERGPTGLGASLEWRRQRTAPPLDRLDVPDVAGAVDVPKARRFGDPEARHSWRRGPRERIMLSSEVVLPFTKKPPPQSNAIIFSDLSARNSSTAFVAPGQIVNP